jgi:lysophospholipase L1-like esterase
MGLAAAVAYSLPPMSPTASRPRRSRAGLFLFLFLLALVCWEVLGRVTPLVPVTPLAFGRAAWKVATQVPPNAEELAKNAYRPLPYVMYGLKPSWERPARKLGDQMMPASRSNSLGFRGEEIESPKPAGRYRIICLGGSTTYSDTVGDDETYPVLLEQELRKARPDRDIEVINAGVPSYTTAETLPNLAFRCLDLQPDAIVLYEGINDFRTRNYANYDNAYFHYRKVWNGTVETWEKGEGELQGINAFIQNKPPENNGSPIANIKRAGTYAFRRNLVSIAGIAKAHGVKVVLVSCTYDAANEYMLKLPEFGAGIQEHNQVVKAVAQEQGALFIDMAASFTGAGQFADAVHMNPAGSRQMARRIAEGLLQGLL